MKRTKRTYRVKGVVYGKIWMPCADCWKRFDTGEFEFTDGDTYCPPRSGFRGEFPDWRTALLSVSNDGDFQSCGILKATVVVTNYYGIPLPESNRKTVRTMELKGRDGNRDLWVKGGPVKRRRILDRIFEGEMA